MSKSEFTFRKKIVIIAITIVVRGTKAYEGCGLCQNWFGFASLLGFAFVADLPTRTLFTIGGLLILFGLTEFDTGRLVDDVIDFGEFRFVVVSFSLSSNSSSFFS